VVPDALLLTGAGLAYVTFATTRYGPEAFQNVYENLRSIVQLFQLIMDEPKRSLKDATNKKKALVERWEVLESVRGLLRFSQPCSDRRLVTHFPGYCGCGLVASCEVPGCCSAGWAASARCGGSG